MSDAEQPPIGRLVSGSTVRNSAGQAVLTLDSSTKVAVAGNPKRPPDSTGYLAAAGSNNPNMDYGQLKFFDYNFHSVKKGVSSALLDVSLLMANSSQLKSVIVAGPEAQFYYVMLVLLIISITLQVIVGCILIWLSRININEADEKRHDQAEILNNIIVVGIFLMTLVNVFIASIGISS